MAVSEDNGLLFVFIAGSVFVLLLIFGFFIVLSRSQRRIALEQAKLFKTREENQRKLLEAILKAQEAERKRLAREMHDELGQMATVQKINLSLFRRKIAGGIQPGELPELLAEVDLMINDANESIQSVKRIIHDLRPISLEELGLLSEIRNLIERIGQRTGIKTVFISDETDLELKEEHAVEVFRIVQEAITNVLRHAEASTIEVRLERKNDKLVICINDDGKGINLNRKDSPKSFGLRGMSERAMLIGGHLVIEKAPEKGTQVRLVTPINEN